MFGTYEESGNLNFFTIRGIGTLAKNFDIDMVVLMHIAKKKHSQCIIYKSKDFDFYIL